MRLTVPPSLGFGDDGLGDITGDEIPSSGDSLEGEVSTGGHKVPPGAHLEYEVSVLNVEDGGTDQAGFLQI